ncbi:MAG: GGDEF domain-containing protein [Syntrophobacterales bacterium]|nr:GGDEF domain-containing protein [Syntrophobacterales bacterium]
MLWARVIRTSAPSISTEGMPPFRPWHFWTRRRFTIAMIDADHFKKLNDPYGHGFGDVVLGTLAERFVESFRPRDRVHRFGGEEFVILLPDIPLDQARPVLKRLRQRACGRDISDGEIEITQSVSIGAAEATGPS